MTAKTKKMKAKTISKSTSEYFDYSLLAVLVFLVCFGLVMLYSVSSYSALIKYGNSMHYLTRQLIFTVAGFAGLYVASRLPLEFYRKVAFFSYMASLALMALVQTPLGKEVNGAKRWLKLPGDQQLQPAEIAKIALIIYIPLLIIKFGKEYKQLKQTAKVLCAGLVAAAFALFLTDNLSTAVILMGITVIIVFISHPKTKPFLMIGVALVVLVGGFLVYVVNFVNSTGNFRMNRILMWLKPEEYSGDNFQSLQGLYAIGSGGLFGKGLGNGAQKMVIPEVQNDMILSVICEELGIFGAIMILILFGLVLYRLFFIAQNAPDLYSSLVVTGIFAHIALQVMFNVGVVTGVLPTTGITLPFISYGGTSTLFLLTEMGVALGVSRRIRLD
ncbi:FtsW/RodA/SpoVE family cell cycle protein [Ohessyouella blattaphilus]|uniref:Probable peptidoglycan glycosyltransferase FtsW n=1 Tax=Ohessyouella blattaphilus TaxID=2949333 RepID=A0ABT1ED88_9FIRM|nr:putative peptidoglycan glycosyltransferase FtsW [Ohessyouella blattaphilus]MCP1108654.1 putative lipid II flippase FtsW [Ohessyouella blattaphilus]MCR8562048.1 putative lipid II flippase FtsW [Ohessyouella blattaphilus]